MMMSLPKFVFCENKSALPGAGLILCTESPFFYGQVMKGFTMEEIVKFAERNKAVAASKIYDYKIGVIITGALHSSVYVADMQRYAQDCATLAREMSDFYLEEKIKLNLKYYERYKEEEI